MYYIGCLQDFSGGLLWPTSRRNGIVTQSCSILHPYFRSQITISRKCNDDGTWGPVDDSSCTALNNAIPILIISFIVNVSRVDAQLVVDNVSCQPECCNVFQYHNCEYIIQYFCALLCYMKNVM